MRTRSMHFLLGSFITTFAIAGSIWAFRRSEHSVGLGHAEVQIDPIPSYDLRQRLRQLRSQIDKVSREESWALVAIDNAAQQMTFNVAQAEHVRQCGVPKHLDFYMEQIELLAKETVEKRDQAASLAHKKHKLEEEFYNLLASAAPKDWLPGPNKGSVEERMHLSPASP